MNKDHQLLRGPFPRSDRATHTPASPRNCRSDFHFGVDRRALFDCVVLATIAIACVGLMVLGSI